MVLTPQGHISRYFYGVDFPPKDLRMGLVEASQNKIGNAVDQVLCTAITTILRPESTARSFQHAETRRAAHHPASWRTLLSASPGKDRAAQNLERLEVGSIRNDFKRNMFDNFPLWPSRASTAAGNVDALFIFLLIVSGLMTLLIFTAVVYLCCALP